MANLNKVMLIGNLTRDPELRVTPKGVSVCLFSLAVNRRWRDEAGADCEEVTYVDIEAWGKAGEAIARWCGKGRPLFVEGRLRLDQWEDKQTQQKRSRMKVVCEGFEFLVGQRSGDGRAGAGAAPPVIAPAAPAIPPPRAVSADDLDEDVPF